MDTRNDDRYLEQIAEAWRMRVYEHATQPEIATALGVHQTTVSRWLAKTARERTAERQQLIERYFAEQLEQLDMLYRETMLAWERSKQPTKRIVKRVGRTVVRDGSGQAGVLQGPQLVEEVVVTRVTDQVGNVRYVQQAGAILAAIRALLQLNGPKTREITRSGGTPVPNIVLYLPDNGRGDSLLAHASAAPPSKA